MSIDFDNEKILKLRWDYIFVGLSGFLVVVALALDWKNIIQEISIPKNKNKSATSSFSFDQQVSLTEGHHKKIYDRNLFNKTGELGDVTTGSDESVVNENEASKTTLPLEVLGIIYGGTPFSGLATIKNKSKGQINSFIVGDFIGKAEVVEIHRTRVFIKNRGRLEFIEMDEKSFARTSRRGKKTKEPKKPGYSPIAKGPALKEFKEEGFERSGNQMKMSADYKQRLLTVDFSKVLQDAKASPNMIGGQVKGFVLTRIREGSVYQKAGLQNQDIIEEINGVQLTNAPAAIRLLQSLRSEKEIEIVVNRDGNVFPMELSVQ